MQEGDQLLEAELWAEPSVELMTKQPTASGSGGKPLDRYSILEATHLKMQRKKQAQEQQQPEAAPAAAAAATAAAAAAPAAAPAAAAAAAAAAAPFSRVGAPAIAECKKHLV